MTIIKIILLVIYTLQLQAKETFKTIVDGPRGQLETHIYLSHAPSPEKTMGTILIRSPYLLLHNYHHKINFWRDQGFHVVTQSIAGTGNSTGSFRYLGTEEINDAKITIEWLSRQTFHNHKIILYGESYDGFLALAGGLNNHPHVKAIIAASAPTNPMLDSFTAGSMVEFDLLKYYLDLPSPKALSQNYFRKQIKALYQRNVDYQKYDDFFRPGGIKDWDDIIDESFNLSFHNRGIYRKLHQIEAPLLLMAGELQDQDATDAIHAYKRRKSYFNSYTSRCPTKLALGPWTHGVQTRLSQQIAANFAKNALEDRIECESPHQIEFYSQDQQHNDVVITGSRLYPHIFKRHKSSFTRDQVELGYSYVAGTLDHEHTFPLPKVCQPWAFISPGLERPFISVPIAEDLTIHGPIDVEMTFKSPRQEIVDLSVDIIIDRQIKSWVSLDEHYNIHRTRKRIPTKEQGSVSVNFQTPYLSLNLKKGDSIIISPQRAHHSLSHCDQESVLWNIEDKNPTSVSFLYQK